MEFRPAKEAELPAVLRLYRSMVGTAFCTWDEEYPGQFEIEQDFAHHSLYLLMDEAEIVGAISIVPDKELEELDCWQCRDHTAELSRVVIRSELQGKGLSKRLVTEAETVLKQSGIKAVHLLAAVKNIPANKCYASCGYVRYAPIEMYDNLYYPCEKWLGGKA